jgi:hypothetical protein
MAKPMTEAEFETHLRELDANIQRLEQIEAEYRAEWESCDDHDTRGDITRTYQEHLEELDCLRNERIWLEQKQNLPVPERVAMRQHWKELERLETKR